ncbi:hypothetical protein [Vibrio toranzoniae]|uniref:hypothetical protein n=1 Tax=Vibrio toranzoniae TaxID=1194427 RepID=UPI0013776C69|nr:hypothetical protein [Vibrio toranzoniae]NAZ91641.1 hypothetical protein [Vibrio toranzoniae]
MKKLKRSDVLVLIGNIYEDKLQSEYYDVLEVDPIDLLNEKRLDIILKLSSIPYYLNESKSKFLKNIYLEHIKCLTEGTYKENGSLTKNSIDAFESEFTFICQSIRDNGFLDSKSLVPVSSDMTPINGAHRVAASIYFESKIQVVIIPEVNVNYGKDFFIERGLNSNIINFAMNNLVEMSDKFVCGITWPASNITADGINDEIENIIDLKSINITKQGMHNLICEAYSNESWLGSSSDSYKGAWKKALPCFGNGESESSIVNFFTLRVENKNLIDMKSNIRNKFKLGKHSIHICDDNKDSLRLLKYFNNNSFEKIINSSSHYRYRSFINNLELIKNEVINKNVDNLVLDGSSLLGILGLREPSDVDYLSISDLNLKNADCHNKYAKYYEYEIEDMMLDPNHHVNIYGFKFLSPENIICFKKNRNENKDKNDIELLKSFGTDKKLTKLILKFKSDIYFFKIKNRILIVKALESLGLKKILKKLLGI